jgi:hypothetical protein
MFFMSVRTCERSICAGQMHHLKKKIFNTFIIIETKATQTQLLSISRHKKL